MPVINTNINAQYSQDALKVNAKAMGNVMQQLATGSRINAAKDDAAGLSITQNMTSQIRGLNQAVRNVNDGINLLQTADGALVETAGMLQRMRELAVQSSNGVNSGSQRGYLDKEFKSLQEEINRIAANTSWNNMTLVNGSGVGAANTSMTFVFQAGIASGQTISISIDPMHTSALGIAATGTSGISIANFASAQLAITAIDVAIENVSLGRSAMGATMNQLSYSADNMVNISTNIGASRSTILDTDYATASAQLAKNQIISQAATAMLAQANQQPQSVLTLLK
jgi:flagellin